MIGLFEKHRIPVSDGEGGGLISVAEGAVTIVPPYNPEDCSAFNEVILNKIQNIMKSQPT